MIEIYLYKIDGVYMRQALIRDVPTKIDLLHDYPFKGGEPFTFFMRILLKMFRFISS